MEEFFGRITSGSGESRLALHVSRVASVNDYFARHNGGQLKSDAHEESLKGQQQLAVESNDGTVAPKEATKRGISRKIPASNPASNAC